MSRMTRRDFLKRATGTIALALGGAGLVSACGAEGRAAAPKKTLQFWAFSDTRTFWQQKAFELYKKERQPDFDINFLILPYQQMHDKVMVATQAGAGGPDIADIEISQFARFIKGQPIFVDLRPKLEREHLLDKLYTPSATDPWSWSGRIYGLGNELNACLWSYRWDVLEKAKVKVPIETWDEFVDQAEKFHKDTGSYLVDFPTQDWSSWWMMTLQQGKGFFGPNGLPTLTTPEGIRTLAFQKQALEEWSTQRPSGQAYYVALSAGKIASLLGPSWAFSGFVQQNLPKSKGKWHLQLFPAWKSGGARTATWGGTGVSVLTTSPHAKEAESFVVWEHTTTRALMFDFEHRQTWPTYKPAFQDPRLTEPIAFFDNQRVGKLVQAAAEEIPKWYNSPYWPEVVDATVRVAVTPALTSSESAKSALENAQRESMGIIRFETARVRDERRGV